MDPVSNTELVVYAFIAIFTAFLSSVAGGGGGFVTTPLLIFLGLSPAQAVATGKISGLAIALGSVTGLRKGGVKYSKRQVFILSILALAVGLVVPFIIKNLEAGIYQKILGVLLLLMIPVVIKKKLGDTSFVPSKKRKTTGYFLVTVIFFIQGITSTGVGLFVNIALMSFLGLKNLTANIVKRYSQLILNSVIVLGLLFSGLIVWKIALVSVVVNLIGGHIGGDYATKISPESVRYFFVAFMLISGVALLIS